MKTLTTHVLDTIAGVPAAGIRIELWREGNLLGAFLTNGGGRSERPLLEGDNLIPAAYELRFHVGEYFARLGVESPFLDVVPVWFRVEEGKSYHVPLVVSPWAYSTYRGS
jgi:5-hydroxyisourate hydrolase